MGLVHIYFGDGKGKTTAALGLGLRALGDGLHVCLCQFLKATPTGELAALAQFENATVLRAENETDKFLWQMSAKEQEDCLRRQRSLLERVALERADIFLLDEVLSAMQVGAFSLDDLSLCIAKLRERGEVILTGHQAPDALLAQADYITKMQKLRHPYDQGVPARRGIEY